jgi:N-acetylglucosaminyl-diphospho-decaprenol L-rhamnosyltransferase
MTEVAIVTVSYHSEDVLPAMLDSIPDAITERYDVVVVDNASDPALDAVIAGRPDVRRFDPRANLGYGGAVNAARPLLGNAEWILVVNPDVVFEPGSIDALVSRGRESTDVGSLGPLITGADGTPYPSARKLPSLRTGVGHALFVRFWPENPWTASYREDDAPASETRDAGWLSGACLLVRREAFDAVGGFDDGFFMYFEDVDLGRRLGLAGWRNVFEPAARITHSGAHSTAKESARMLDAHHRSAYRYLAKRYHNWYLWPVRVVLRVALAARRRVTSW